MYVTRVQFEYQPATSQWNADTQKQEPIAAHWDITATLNEKLSRYGSSGQTMNFAVTEEIGQKLAEVLLPVVVADASRKAQQLADDSKAMAAALGERTIQCLIENQKSEASEE